MIDSPCIKRCDQMDGVCQGCFRTVEQIERWYQLSTKEKLEVRKEAIERRNEKLGTDYYGFPG